jgi:hypothetical protein
VGVATQNALRAVAERIPNAEIVLVGYPKLTSPPCPSSWNDAIFRFQIALDVEQAKRIKKLNKKLRTDRFHWAPTASDFNGRGPCAFFWIEWVHDIVLDPFWESFHPNRTGHQVVGDKLYRLGYHDRQPLGPASLP